MTDAGVPPRVRATARIVLLDEHDRALLFRYEDPIALDPSQSEVITYWATVGDGGRRGRGRRDVRDVRGGHAARAVGGDWPARRPMGTLVVDT